jgi:hypothetical protein
MNFFLTKISPLIIGICLCALSIRFIINPRGWRDSRLRHLSQKRKGFLLELRKDFLQGEWYVINLRIGGIAVFLFGLLTIWFAILAIKS